MKLRADNVSHNFGSTAALAPTTLEVADGEFASIVGPSGCGKSTLFNIISGLLRPTAGRVFLDEKDVTGETGRVGYMLQKDLLLPWRTVTQNIVLGASLTGRVTRRDKEEAVALARRYGLGEFVDHYPHTLSGGMRQRVALMRTLAVHKDVMLLDEPFGALDSQTRLRMQQWLLDVWHDQERTVLFITHDVDEAIFLSDRVHVMSARPGAFRASYEIDLPRPRSIEILTSEPFIAMKREILQLIYSETLKQLAQQGEAA